MKIDCGIIGLPNVGKSTLFNALTNATVKVDNFPFSTIQPNIAIIEIPDTRLYQINQIIKSKIIKFAVIEFMDIAGLIKGASQGEGLGNKILHYIKNANILCHVVRCFDNDQIIHIENNINPQRDIDIINTELILFDISQCEKTITSLKNSRVTNHDIDQIIYCLEKCLDGLYNGLVLRKMNFSKIDIEYIKKYSFLTFKPIIYIANINSKNNNNFHFKKLKKISFYENAPIISFCAANNKQSTLILKNDNYIMMLNAIINHIVSILQLNTFFTTNLNMTRSWIVPIGTIAPDAAYYVHSDFKKGFIRAQVIKSHDFITNQGESGAKKSGKIRFVGRDYQIEDGDIIKFLFQR